MRNNRWDFFFNFSFFKHSLKAKSAADQRRMADGDSAPPETQTLRITTRAPPALNASSRYANWICIQIQRGSSTHPLFWRGLPQFRSAALSVVIFLFFLFFISRTSRRFLLNVPAQNIFTVFPIETKMSRNLWRVVWKLSFHVVEKCANYLLPLPLNDSKERKRCAAWDACSLRPTQWRTVALPLRAGGPALLL